jgi:NADPH-dependent ferric siderophore reductase
MTYSDRGAPQRVPERERGRASLGFLGRALRPPLPTWELSVAETTAVTPRTLGVSFSCETLGELTWHPGQDLVLELPQPDGSTAARHYTIRAFGAPARRLDIDFVLHGDSPAVRWAKQARPGERIMARGPRGRTRFAASAHSHLFLGDETALPAIFAMAESMAEGRRGVALVECDGPAEAQALHSDADVKVEWVDRRGAAPGPSTLTLRRLIALNPDPTGTHAYVLGETSNVRAMRHWLLERGFAKEQITAESYWRPGRIGGHDHV